MIKMVTDKTGTDVTLQDDNLFVMHDDGVPVWQTEASTHEGADYLVMEDSGNLVQYRADGATIWTSP